MSFTTRRNVDYTVPTVEDLDDELDYLTKHPNTYFDEDGSEIWVNPDVSPKNFFKIMNGDIFRSNSYRFKRFQYAWVDFCNNGQFYGSFKMYMRHLQEIRGLLMRMKDVEPFDIYITTIDEKGKVLEKVRFEF